MIVKHGSYTGDGGATKGITGVGFLPDAVLIKRLDSAGDTIMRVTANTSNFSMKLRSDASAITDGIITLDSDGFTVGVNNDVNANFGSFAYVAIKDNGAGDFASGVYLGNNTDGKAITGLGFQPNYVVIKSDSNIVGAHKYAGNTNTSMFFGGDDRSDLIVSLDAGGFTVNNGGDSGANIVNVNAVNHYWIAFKEVTDKSEVFTYVGNRADNRSITTPGFQPAFVSVKATISNEARLKYKIQTGDNSQNWDSPQSANGIQAFKATGFQVGTDSSVNNNTNTYYTFALADDFTTSAAAPASTTWRNSSMMPFVQL